MREFYICIDLKTFYASVECAERNLDPFKTDLIVADKSRGKGTITLAITPKMKQRGIKNRCRVYEIPKNVKPIFAKPRMQKYLEYSAKIYSIYLKYFDKEDIHVYSIDEVFIYITPYLQLYQKNPIEIAKMIMNEVFVTTKITATAGVGTNMYLAKVALDIISKHSKTNIGYLNEELYKEKLWNYTPITDFWQIGAGIANRLSKYHIKTMKDITLYNPQKLYKEFGINAEFLIDHAFGKEICTIKDIKNYKVKNNSISNSQILLKDYDYKSARIVLIEMIDNIVLRLVNKKLYANKVGFYIGYSKNNISSLKVSFKLENPTSSYFIIKEKLLSEYDYRINENELIRRIGVFLSDLTDKKVLQLNLFKNEENLDEKVEEVICKLKQKYGKNIVLRSLSLCEEATAKYRNSLIGGHNAK